MSILAAIAAALAWYVWVLGFAFDSLDGIHPLGWVVVLSPPPILLAAAIWVRAGFVKDRSQS